MHYDDMMQSNEIHNKTKAIWGIFILGMLHAFFTDFWYVTHTILRHTIHVKFGEKGLARGWMVNLLHHINLAKQLGKKLDVMDYMWNELKTTVRCNKVPIYGSYLQTLIDSKIPARLANNYLSVDSVTPATQVLTTAKKGAAVRSRSKRARPSSFQEEHSSSAYDSPPAASPVRAPESKAKFSITMVF